MSYVVDKMRKATTVGALAGDIGQSGGGEGERHRGQHGFDYPEPAKAQAVMQSYVTQFLRMDSDQVEDQANLTVRFLRSRLSSCRLRFREIEGQSLSSRPATARPWPA